MSTSSAAAPAAMRDDFADLVTRLRQLAAAPAVRSALAQQGVIVRTDEDDARLTLGTVADGVLEERFGEALVDMSEAFDRACADGQEGKLKAKFVATVTVTLDTSNMGVSVAAATTLSTPKGQARAEPLVFEPGGTFRRIGFVSVRQQRLPLAAGGGAAAPSNVKTL